MHLPHPLTLEGKFKRIYCCQLQANTKNGTFCLQGVPRGLCVQRLTPFRFARYR